MHEDLGEALELQLAERIQNVGCPASASAGDLAL